MSSEGDRELVYMYIDHLYNKYEKGVPVRLIKDYMEDEFEGSSENLSSSLKSLLEEGLIERDKYGFKPLTGAKALRRQMEMEEVVPFTRVGEDLPESHLDKVYSFSTPLIKPVGRFGLIPTSPSLSENKKWERLYREG